ncbi:MAG: phage portal protein [Sarcina sp.]
MAFKIDKRLVEDGIPKKLLVKLITKHRNNLSRFNKLDKYFEGEHEILKRTIESESLPNNKIVCNHAKFITDMAVGYFIGEPIMYESSIDIELITDCFKSNDESSHNTDLAEDVSIYGVGYELLYMSDDEIAIPSLGTLDVRETFTVTDNSVAAKTLFAVNYYETFDEDDKANGFIVNVYDDSTVTEYFFKELDEKGGELREEESHFFGRVPIIEYKNNARVQGDFEQVISLIDAYNLLQSDRVNDKEQLVDAILAIYGSSIDEADARLLKLYKMLNLNTGDKAEWLTKTLNENEIEVLKKALEEDIHKFSMVPCMTDKNFIGNSSGVAMKFKLLGLEQLCKKKERFFSVGLRERLNMISNILSIKGTKLNSRDIHIVYSRSLPANEIEISQMINNLEGKVSNETLISKIPFVHDPVQEIEKLRAEKKENFTYQQGAFGFPVDDSDSIKEDEEKDIVANEEEEQ